MNTIEHHADICQELHDLYTRKNHDYGDSFHETYLEEGLAMARIRLSDKLNRFKTLSRASQDISSGHAMVFDKDFAQHVADESLRDTLIDLANYAIMTVMELDREKENRE